MRTRLDIRFWRFAVPLLVLEAAAILLFSSEGRQEVLGGDAAEYDLFARNLLDHGVFSRDVAPPYEPSVRRTPGYPLFLAALRLIGGDSLLLVRGVQFVLVGVLAVLVYAIAREIFDRRTARIAAVLCLTYLPFLWLARRHLTEVLTAVLLAGIVLLLVRARRAPSGGRLLGYAVIGAILGLTAMVRPSYAFAAVPIALGLVLWPAGPSRRRAALQIGALSAGLVLVLIPWTVRNAQVTDGLRPFGSGGGVSLLASARQYQGTTGFRFDRRELTELGAAAVIVYRPVLARAEQKKGARLSRARHEALVDDALSSEARRILEGLSVADVLQRGAKRSAYLWAVSDYAPEATYTTWHRVAEAQHVLLFAMALLGLAVAARRARSAAALWLVLLFPVFVAVAHLVLHSEGRYSVPVRSMVLLFSAVGMAFLWERVTTARGAGTPRA